MYFKISFRNLKSISLEPVLECFDERVAEFSGWYACSILGGVELGIVVAPTVVLFPAHLSPAGLVGHSRPSKHHLRDASMLIWMIEQEEDFDADEFHMMIEKLRYKGFYSIFDL